MASWTFMVYMAGFNNLSSAATEDLDEMRVVGSTDDVNIAVFVKRLDKAAERIIVRKAGEGETSEEIGEADSGNPQTLLDFVRWAAKTAPAERYALVVWNHGGGWRVTDLDQIYAVVRSRGGGGEVTTRELGVRAGQQIGRSLFSTSIEKVLDLPNAGAREIACDDGTGHSLDTIELRNVLEKAVEELGRPLDLLGMDACLMSTLEVAFEAQEYAGGRRRLGGARAGGRLALRDDPGRPRRRAGAWTGASSAARSCSTTSTRTPTGRISGP